MLHYLVLLLFPLVIHCQNKSSSDIFCLNDTVIRPYRTALTLFNEMIVNKLISIDLTHVNNTSSNQADELYCTIQEIQSNLKQAISANDNLVRHIGVHVDQLIDSVARLKNETVQVETTMFELNETIKNAQEQVRLAQQRSNGSERIFKEMMSVEYDRAVDRCKDSRSNPYPYPRNDRWKRFVIERDFFCSPGYTMHAYRSSPSYPKVSGTRDRDSDNLKKKKIQLEEKIVEYKSAQSQAMNKPLQLAQVNLTLQQQRTAEGLAANLNTDFKLIDKRLQVVSTPSKRLIDVLTMMFNFKVFTEPLASIYKKLLSAQIIESIPVNITHQAIDKLKHKLVLIAAKLPQVRYRQKQLGQSCAST
jgi:hypothetical protein